MFPLITTSALLSALLLFPSQALAVDLSSIIDAYGLTSASYNFTWPDEALNSDDAYDWIVDNWSLNADKADWGSNYIVFSADPSTTSSTLVRRRQSSTEDSTSTESSSDTATATSSATTATSTVSSPTVTDLSGEAPAFRIEYPEGSYSKQTGGTQFYAQPLNSTSSSQESSALGNTTSDGNLERMLLSYDIWFPSGFGFNQGGKLPGLKGGPDSHGCSGGDETDGTTCFSTRLMWRTSGAGEVYAYIPTDQDGFCSEDEVTCNSDYGTSLARDSFSFATGQWQTIYMLVILNDPDTANGVVELWYNGVSAMSFTDLVIRKSSSIESIGGLYFSTFFGGDDSSWASPSDQFIYFRNIQLYGGLGASNATGSAVSSDAGKSVVAGGWRLGMGVVLGLFGVSLGTML